MNTYKFVHKAKEIHGDKYDYSLVEYIDSKTKLKIICQIHGIFNQISISHLNGCGCTYCKESKGELKIREFLEINNIEYTREYKFDNCKSIYKLPFDFYLPKYNLCIEYDGQHHYYSIEYYGGEERFIKCKERDAIKTLFCKDNNINLLRIAYYDFYKIEEVISNHIQSL